MLGYASWMRRIAERTFLTTVLSITGNQTGHGIIFRLRSVVSSPVTMPIARS